MSDFVSARPALLAAFIADDTRNELDLAAQIQTLSAAFDAFVSAPGGDCAAQGAALLHQLVPGLATELSNLVDFVKLVHDAVMAADNGTSTGIVTVSGAELVNEMNRIAGERGIDINSLAAVEAPVTATVPQVGVIPPDSGYVNDPVCTATGHLVVADIDFAMPPRLRTLAFDRRYSSGSPHVGAFGTGWWTWCSVALTRVDDSSVHLVCPDGSEVGISIDEPAEADADATFTAHDNGAITVEWSASSRFARQRWTFDDSDLLRVVESYDLGVNTLEHDSDGRLQRIVHESGRSVQLSWRADRVVQLVSSDGRTAEFGYDTVGRLTTVSNAFGATQFSWNDQGRIESFTDADGVVLERMRYDADGRVLEQTSATGHVTRFEYLSPRRTVVQDADGTALAFYVHDSKGRVELFAAADGTRLTRRFDTSGRVVSQQQIDGRSFTVETSRDSDGGGRVDERRWSTGAVEVFRYDELDRLVHLSDDRGSTAIDYGGDEMHPTRVVGDAGLAIDIAWLHGSPISVIDSDDVSVTFDATAEGTVTSKFDAYGHETRYSIHPSGEIEAVEFPDGRQIRLDRDNAGRLIAIVDGAGAEMRFDYTPAGRLLRCIDPVGAVTALRYADSGVATHVVGPDGAVTEWLTDTEQRPIGVRLADGTAIDIELDLLGRPVKIDVDNRSAWSVTRDLAGRPSALSDPLGNVTSFAYGIDGLSTAITDPSGATWVWQRDMVDRIRRLTNPDGSTETVDFGPNGRIGKLTDAAGESAVLSYTRGGRVLSRTSRDSVTTYRYDRNGAMVGFDHGRGRFVIDRDSVGRPVMVTSPEGRTRTYTYDRVGRLASVDIGGATWSYTHDQCGRLATITDPIGRAVRYEYDLSGRVVAVTDPAGATTNFEYDSVGRLRRRIDPLGGACEYRWNHLGLPVEITDELGRRTTTQYDAAGRQIATINADGRSTRYELDRRGLVTARINSDEERVTYGRDLLGQVTAVQQPGRPVATLAWAPTGRPLADTRDGADALTDPAVRYERDADGYVITAFGPGLERRWQRDGRGSVTSIVSTDDHGETRCDFTHDASGRITSCVTDGVDTRFTYDSAGRLAAVHRDGVTWSWTYDAAGRLVAETGPDGPRTYAYDGAHQLISIDEVAGRTTFHYDARGRRVRSEGVHVSSFAWSDDGLRSFTINGQYGASTADGLGLVNEVAGSSISWNRDVSPPVPVRLGSATLAGTVPGGIGVFDGDRGVWPGAATDDPWGSVAADTGATTWHPFFGPSVCGLVWLGERVYDTATRQFLSRDPVATVLGSAALSPYAYADNDPVNLFDPLGTTPVSLADFKKLMDAATSVQLGHIVKIVVLVAVSVAIVAVCPASAVGFATVLTDALGETGAAIAAGVIVGAAAGGLSSAANDLILTGRTSVGSMVKGAVIGGLTGGVGEWIGGAVKSSSSLAVAAVRGGVTGLVSSTVSETYDALGLPGGDGTFDPGQLLLGTGAGEVGTVIGERWVDEHLGVRTPVEPQPVRSPEPPTDLPDGPTVHPPNQPTPNASTPASNAAPSGTATPGPGTPSAGSPGSGAPTADEPLPIKGNIGANGKIYHTSDSRYYNQTKAEVTFKTAQEAEAAGFRPPKNMVKAK